MPFIVCLLKSMSFAEYALQVNEIQPTTALNGSLIPRPVAHTEPCDIPCSSSSDITPMNHTKQEIVPLLSPGRPKANDVRRSPTASPSNPPRKIPLCDHFGDLKFPQPNGYKCRPSKPYAKTPARQLTTPPDEQLRQRGIILTPTSSEANSDLGRSAAPKPDAGQAQDSDIELTRNDDKEVLYDSDASESEKAHSSACVLASGKPRSGIAGSMRTVQSVEASRKPKALQLQLDSRALRPEDEVEVEKGWGTWGRGGKSQK
ncbi:hypothetical protein N7G274_009281 [Stereocaulon virgatum]|uniref:Uncharacterized protein n=1 Tax=Stereocaulon virgatum TaxID=373712 RepID=A0ABR3ZZD9_9LECA